MNYAIVGFGTAGYHAVEAIRRQDPEGRIDVYSDTGKAPYNPMLTTYYIYGKINHDGLYPFGDMESIRKRLGFTLLTQPVEHVYAKTKTVKTASGEKQYDRILIATGATAFAPPVKGLAPEDTFLMRTVTDSERLKERLDKTEVRHAIVVGASMAGIKVVEVLHKYGVDTYLADLAPCIFSLAAYPDIAAVIEKRVENQGIHLCFQSTIDHMEERDGQKVAVMTDQTAVPADLVVLCIGTRASTGVVKDEVAINRGIIVNERMETSAEGIYAAGDCCEGNNLESGQTQIIGLWANANHQGSTAGANMAGGEAGFDGNILHNITHFMNMDFIGFGDIRIEGERMEYGNPENGLYIRLVWKDGKIAGANILDNYRISGIIKNYMLRLFTGEKGCLPEYQRCMLMKAGLSEEFISQVEEKVNGSY